MKFRRLKRSFQEGQALLVIVLIMVVTLTIGLSLATRSITNSRISTEEDNSQRAFSAAEAGVEQLLNNTDNRTEIPESSLGDGGTTYNAKIMAGSTSQVVLKGGNAILKDQGVDFWLSNYPDYSSPWTGTLTVYWGKENDCSTNPPTAAAIEVVLLTGNKSDPVATHHVFDPCTGGAGSRRASNHFAAALTFPPKSFPDAKTTFVHSADVPVANPGLVARIIPLYNNAEEIVVKKADLDPLPLPSQGKKVESVGSSGGTARKISVFKGNPSLPIELFPYVIFSP